MSEELSIFFLHIIDVTEMSLTNVPFQSQNVTEGDENVGSERSTGPHYSSDTDNIIKK